jgi:hypothetical protein
MILNNLRRRRIGEELASVTVTRCCRGCEVHTLAPVSVQTMHGTTPSYCDKPGGQS